MYRIRPLKKILGDFQELERQQIYFSPFDEQNDPLEGTVDMFWQGDIIVWKNFLCHYLLCLSYESFLLNFLKNSDDLLKNKKIPVQMSIKNFPPQYLEFFKKTKEDFFSKQAIINLLSFLSNRKTPIRRDELLFYLKAINLTALRSVTSIHKENGLHETPEVSKFLQSNEDNIEKYLYILENNIEDEKFDEFFKRLNSAIDQSIIISYEKMKSLLTENMLYFLIDFSKDYLLQIDELVYKKWNIACFMSCCKNVSMWGNYGEGHKGVCLKFKAHNKGGQYYLPIEGPIGVDSNGKIIDLIDMPFAKVEYGNDIIPVDFFRSLFTISVPTLYEEWYKDDMGNISACSDVLKRVAIDKTEQRNYWDKFKKITTSKTIDWAEEKEYRLVYDSFFIDLSDKNDRMFKYNFNDLDGLIFGMRTPMMDKNKIIEILNKKCKEYRRKDFKLYQADYDHRKKEMTIEELKMINLG